MLCKDILSGAVDAIHDDPDLDIAEALSVAKVGNADGARTLRSAKYVNKALNLFGGTRDYESWEGIATPKERAALLAAAAQLATKF